MGVLSKQSQEDLEKCTCTYVEERWEEKIQLLEDSPTGKLSYFILPYFSESVWIRDNFFCLGGVLMAFSPLMMYFTIYESLYPEYQAKVVSDIFDVFSTSWLIIHYFLYYAVFLMSYIYCKATINIESDLLKKLLEEVAEIELVEDPEPWRRIAFRINSCFVENKYSNPVFYSGEQCRSLFVRELVKPIESWSYDGSETKSYCEDVSNRILAEKAITNYKKSIVEFEKLSEKDEKNYRTDLLFDRFHYITLAAVFSLFLIEAASVLLMGVGWTGLLICYAIFMAIRSLNFFIKSFLSSF